MISVTLVKTAVVIMREGAEALLIIAALAAYLGRVGAEGKVRVLYWGSGLAIAASATAAWMFWLFFDGGHSDLLEGVVMLLAAGVLIYVSGWLFAKRDAAAWQGYIKGRVEAAIGTGGMLALGAAAFLAVFREGAETILFLYALASEGSGAQAATAGGIAGGILLGGGVLVAAFLGVRKLALRLPLKPFFTGTAVLLYGLAVLFIGPALIEFQEMEWLPYDSAPVPEWLVGIGVSDTFEGLAIQLALLAAVPIALKLMPALRAQNPAEAPG
jgi:high-affinity iron transporter